MNKFVLKYIGISAATLFSFVNFIACGAQMYKVSLEDDHDQTKVSQEAANPDSVQFGIHAPAGWAQLPIKFKFSQNLNKQQLEGLKLAIATWEKAVGRDLFEFVGTDTRTGDSFKDLYGSLADGENASYLDLDWGKTGKSTMVLATTIWDNSHSNHEAISTADIHFNEENYIIGDTFALTHRNDDIREIVDMQTLALHEVGHLLGLSHKDPAIDSHSIMNPSIFIGEGLANRRLSEGDIRSIQQIYSCAGEACDIAALVNEMETSVAYNGAAVTASTPNQKPSESQPEALGSEKTQAEASTSEGLDTY